MLAALAAIMTFDPVPGPAKLQLCEKIKGFPASEEEGLVRCRMRRR
jgi:hypothetical protein